MLVKKREKGVHFNRASPYPVLVLKEHRQRVLLEGQAFLDEQETVQDSETFLHAVKGRDTRQCKTWLLCVSNKQPEIQVSRKRTHGLVCKVK